MVTVGPEGINYQVIRKGDAQVQLSAKGGRNDQSALQVRDR